MENVIFRWFLGGSQKANIEYYGGRRAKVELSGVVLEAKKLPNVTYIVVWVILEAQKAPKRYVYSYLGDFGGR